MSNNTGILSKNGSLYLNGEQIQGGGSSVNNTFNKICVYGTSIETTPSVSDCWAKHMANALGLTYGTQVINHGKGGGGICWYGNDTYITDTVTGYKDFVLAGFSCTQAEKQECADYFVGLGYITAEEVATAKNDIRWNLGFEESVLAEQDVDLYIFGTYGINDRHNWMRWSDDNGNTQSSYSTFSTNFRNNEEYDLTYDRRTIYGAYNYVLRALYQQNPNAKVVILGQHTYSWDNTDMVNGIQWAVANKWQIPFANWGAYLPMYQLRNAGAKVKTTYNSGVQTISVYSADQTHPRKYAAQLMGQWVADWITHTELTPLNPRWGLD